MNRRKKRRILAVRQSTADCKEHTEELICRRNRINFCLCRFYNEHRIVHAWGHQARCLRGDIEDPRVAEANREVEDRPEVAEMRLVRHVLSPHPDRFREEATVRL